MSDQQRDKSGGPRIVVAVKYAANPWRCLVCGALVADVDDHYNWHLETESIRANNPDQVSEPG